MTLKRTGRRRKWPWVVGGVFVLFLYSLPLFVMKPSGIVHRFEPIRGRVVDDKTGVPLDGAVVVAVYGVTSPTVAGEVYGSVDAAEAVTGPDGVFEVPSRLVFGSLYPGAWFEEVREYYVIHGEYGCLWSLMHPKQLRKTDGLVEFRLQGDLAKEEREQRLDRPSDISKKKYPQFFKLYNQERGFLGAPPLSED